MSRRHLCVYFTNCFFLQFYNFRDEMQDGDSKKDCENLYDCFKTIVGYGIRYPNGVGDFMNHTVGTRASVDVLFFLVVMVVLLNVIFGIIIDTFGDLRSKKIERIEDTTEKCFICGIDKQIFDRASDTPNGFKTHIRFDHNMWNYLYFIIYVWEQDKDDDDGLEQYVRRSLDTNDLSWFPMNRAMQLASTASAEEELRANLTNDIESSDKNLLQKINMFQSDIGDSLDKILFYLKSDDAEENLLAELPPPTADSQDDCFDPTKPATSISSYRGSRASRRQNKKSSVASRGDVSYLSDDMNSVTDDAVINDSSDVKQITIQLESIVEGAHRLVPEDVDLAGANLFCRIVSTTGSLEVPVVSIRHGVLHLDKVEVIVSQSSSSEDTGLCVIELHQKSAGSDTGSQVLGVVAASYGEMIGMSMDKEAGCAMKEFRLPGRDRGATGSFLRLYITCAAAMQNP